MARQAAVQAAWARLGAGVRLAQIDAERAAIVKAFPDLRGGVPAVLGAGPKRRISAKARKAMREGMRRYWAKRKAAQKR